MRLLRAIVITIVTLYGAATLGLYAFQRDIIYIGSHAALARPALRRPSAFRDVTVTTDDHLTLTGWYAPATAKPLTIVYFHGNGDTVGSSTPVAAPYVAAGYGFLITEYRGYAAMPGQPTEAGLYADARAFLNTLITSGVREEDIVVFGYSLGTGVATEMATEFHLRGIMLFAPYLSIAEVAQVRFPILPAAALTRDRFDSLGRISDIHVPILIANGDMDIVVPPSQGHALFTKANGPKASLFLPRAGHGDVATRAFSDFALTWLNGVAALGEK
jgi:fermentation-respiration switch protein FrsA (DUF1100 family)